jgi:hypothetical protein
MTGQSHSAKAVRIVRSEIVVSANRHAETGYIANHRVKGILPGCRLVKELSFSPFANRIVVRPLFGYNGQASISPTAWADLVQSSPIVSDRIFPVVLTTELREWARAEAMQITTCPAVADLREVAQSYLDSLTHDRLEVRP